MQLPLRTRLTLLACLAAAGPLAVQAQPQDAAAAADPAAPAATESPSSGLGLNWSGWAVPPISLGGWVSYDLRASRTEGQTNAVSQLLTTYVKANTFIYQPWFATVSGTLGMTTGRTRGGADRAVSQDPFGVGDPYAEKDRFLTGSARVDLFPLSRFPFEAHVERNDSRIDSALVSTLDYRTQSFGFSQRYQPVSSAYTVSAGFDRRQQVSAGTRDTQDLFVADFATRWKNNDLTLGLMANRARRDPSEEQTEFVSLVGRHQYSPGSALSVNTVVNWSKTDERLVGSASDVSVVQLFSVGLWHLPDSPLAVTGSVRALALRDALADHAIDSLGLTLGATYELNRNARLSANGTATSNSSDGARAQAFSGAVGASWQSDTVDYKGFSYDWSASGTVGGSTGSANHSGSDSSGLENQSQTTLNAQIGHRVSRSWPMSAQSRLMLDAGQDLVISELRSSPSVEQGDPSLSRRALLDRLAATWNVSGDNRSGYVRGSYADSREIGGDHANFRMLNFQVSGNFQFDRNRSLSGDLTWQRITQRSGDRPADTAEAAGLVADRNSSSSVSGEIIYQQQRLFGFPRLRFTSRLKLAQDVLKQPGTFATIPDRETRLWENRLDWLVGRLETQFILRISQVDGKRRDFLMWRVQRSFGD
jgi:hypothetical protein